MPNWVNGLVNGWVKVNSKHVIFPREDGHHKRERRDSNASSLDDSSSRVLDRSRGKNSRKHSHQTMTTASTQGTLDPEAEAIKRFISKRYNKRGLQRTVSHSDLLREMANGGGENKADKTLDKPSTRDNSHDSSYDSNGRQNGTNNGSLRQVAGFFSSAVGIEEKQMNDGHNRSLPSSSSPTRHSSQQNAPFTTGKYLNEAMFVQQLERSKAASAAGSSAASAPERSLVRDHTGPSATHTSRSQPERDHRQWTQEMDSRGNSLNDNGLEKKSLQGRKQHPFAHGEATHTHSQCAGCNEMESKLLAAYDDIRYLRHVSLRSEYSKAPPKSKNSILRGSKHELATLADASKRLTEITSRHRRQIEQMTRETSRKQHDIHFKHSKMSMICKTLNDESSIRKEESLALEEEVRTLKAERDELATEVQRLRTEVSLHKQEQQEHALLREQMIEYEKHSLNQAENAIRERDEIIGDLSSKLERALETLSIEREQQRQRRQIIFPATKSLQQHTSSEQSSSTDVSALQDDLRKAKEAAKASEALLEATRNEAAKREIALAVRCENLENRLKTVAHEDVS